MRKKTGSITIVFMTCLLLFSIIQLCIPSSSAGLVDRLDRAYALRPQIIVVYDQEAAKDPILPLDMIKPISINISYRVDGLYETDIVKYVEDTSIFMELAVLDTPEWCNATISPSFLKVYPSTEWYTVNATMKVKIYENAHAAKEGKIKIQLKLKEFGAVKGGVFENDITFTAGYLPALKIISLSGNSRRVSPGESANFELELENLGNGVTNVEAEVINAPTDWTIGIDPSIILETKVLNQDNKQTITISIVPPNNFGYHQEAKVIDIKFTPKYFANSSVGGSEYIVSFMVKSKGFSAPGFESALILLAVAVLFIAFKIKKKHKDGGKI